MGIILYDQHYFDTHSHVLHLIKLKCNLLKNKINDANKNNFELIRSCIIQTIGRRVNTATINSLIDYLKDKRMPNFYEDFHLHVPTISLYIYLKRYL